MGLEIVTVVLPRFQCGLHGGSRLIRSQTTKKCAFHPSLDGKSVVLVMFAAAQLRASSWRHEAPTS